MSPEITISKGIYFSKVIVICFCIVAAVSLFMMWRNSASFSTVNDFLFKKTIRINTTVFHVWVAHTDEQRATSLNNIDSMRPNQGMLFVFDQDGLYAVSTSGMHFPIDIMWLSKKGVVVSMESNVAPGLPYSMHPKDAARYVLLLNAGIAGKNGIEVGAKLDL